MRHLLVLALVLSVAGLASASMSPTSDIAPIKGVDQGEGGFDGREGGETFATAVIIPSLPYSDVGGTCDNLNDITLPCAASNANDVVYRYTATAAGNIVVSLCGSSYDTALGIYDSGFVNLFCNDDFCGLQSQITFPAVVGATYYFVVDGFSTNCGDYVINVTPPSPPCETACPDGALVECEPGCGPGYVDNWNGGCNSTPNAFKNVICPQTGDEGVFCGIAGNWGSTRDTDWIKVYGTGGPMTASVCGTFPVQLIFIFVAQCPVSAGNYQLATGDPYTTVSITRTVAAGAEVWIWVGTQGFAGNDCPQPYVLTMSGIGSQNCAQTGVCCLANGTCQFLTQAACTGQGGTFYGGELCCDPNPCAVPVETKSWGQIKNNYR